MNEKAYKTMGLTGAANIAIGIVVMVVGVAAGVVAVIGGARLLKNREGLMFLIWSRNKRGKGMPLSGEGAVRVIYRIYHLFPPVFRSLWTNRRYGGISI